MTLTEKYFNKKENLKIRKNIRQYFGLTYTISDSDLMISGGQIFFTSMETKGKIEYTTNIERELTLIKLGI